MKCFGLSLSPITIRIKSHGGSSKFVFNNFFFSRGKVFNGNKDGSSIVRHYLKERLVAKKLRILRHENSRDFMGSTVCLRAEVYGCSFETGEYFIVISSFLRNTCDGPRAVLAVKGNREQEIYMI